MESVSLPEATQLWHSKKTQDGPPNDASTCDLVVSLFKDLLASAIRTFDVEQTRCLKVESPMCVVFYHQLLS